MNLNRFYKQTTESSKNAGFIDGSYKATSKELPYSYKDYIQNSENWNQKRIACLRLYNFKCGYCCASNRILHVHHTEAAKKFLLGSEPVWTLKPLCERCHCQYHLLGRLLQSKNISK